MQPQSAAKMPKCLMLLLLVAAAAAADAIDSTDDIAFCPLHQQHFQKILGYRPDFHLIGSTHDLLQTPAPPAEPPTTTTTTPLYGNDINATIYERDIRSAVAAAADRPPLAPAAAASGEAAINEACWQRCRAAPECSGYVLFLNVSRCYGVAQRERSAPFYTPLRSGGLLLDSNAVYFEKICVPNVPDRYRSKMWLFTRIPGAGMQLPPSGQQPPKTLPMLVTRARCAHQCMLESTFACLSATFIVSHRNNRVRSSADPNVLPDSRRELGTCALSADDKSTRADAFRAAATDDEEYIENQATDGRRNETDACAFESFPRSRLNYADVDAAGDERASSSSSASSKEACAARCAREQRFHCQGISFGWSAGGWRCRLHSEDVLSLGPRALLADAAFVYERRVRCLNVSVICSRTQMTVKFHPDNEFNGRIYVSGHSDECTSVGRAADRSAQLRIALGDEQLERHCGVRRAYQIDTPQHTNRTLLTTLVVVQHNAIVQTQADRLVKVGCIVDNHVRADGNIDDIALASTLGFGGSAAAASGSGATASAGPDASNGAPLFNTTATAPRVSMHIVDAAARDDDGDRAPHAAADVALGQNLELQIRLQPADSPYDIRATQLIARSDTGHSSILLLDAHGCATDPAVFPPMERRRSGGSRQLVARFHAFKFAGSRTVNFEVVVRFCRGECEPERCDGTAEPPAAVRPLDIRRRQRRAAAAAQRVGEALQVRLADPIAVIAGAAQRQRPASVVLAAAAAAPAGERLTDGGRIGVESNEVVSQQVLGRIAAEIVAADGGRSGELSAAAPLPATETLHVQLSVRVPDAEAAQTANSESLIYAESPAAAAAAAGVAGAVDASLADPSGSVCVNRTLLILGTVLWVLLQLVVLAVAGVWVRRYRRRAEAEEDQRELHKAAMENFGFGGGGATADALRRVRWADRQADRSRVLMYT